jgi:hypothetical protein
MKPIQQRSGSESRNREFLKFEGGGFATIEKDHSESQIVLNEIV